MKCKEDCGVCGATLVYAAEDIAVRCHICGKESKTQIYCPHGHYICNTCHRQNTLAILKQMLPSISSQSPIDIAERIMANTEVPMHGPEHHIIVPAAIVTAARNSGYNVPGEALEQAINRSAQIPGGWCGFFGNCGACVGVGIAVSVLTQATPLTGKERSLALEATSRSLANICDNEPRCCKRAVRKAIETAIQFLDEKLSIKLEKTGGINCQYPARNTECSKTTCSYYNIRV
ncbi:DUF5714 domain-containing protein [Chloroflexota bacterium]